jgi:hypothetical protein
MATEPYLIELRGGRFDGHRQPLDYIPSGNRWEMPTLSPNATRREESPPVAVYELRRVSLIQWEDMPTMLFGYDFVGVKNQRRSGADRGPVMSLLRLLPLHGDRIRRAGDPRRSPSPY